MARLNEQKTLSIRQDMLQVWKSLFKFDDIAEDSDFFDLGGDSLAAGRLQRAIDEQFGVKMLTLDIVRHPTVAGLADWLESARERSDAEGFLPSDPHVVPLQPLGKGRPVFAISESLIFRTLALELGNGQPMYILRMSEDQLSTLTSASFEEITDFYAGLIREIQPTGPYRLAGWCVSGWIGYGVARRLEEQGGTVELLAVIDAVSPGYWEQSWPRKLCMKFVYARHRFKIGRRTMTPLQLARKAFKRKETTPETLLADQMDKIAGHAQFSGQLQGKLLLFCSEDETTGRLLPRGLGWERLVGRPVTPIALPGDHHRIFNSPGAEMMAAHILRGIGETRID